MAQFPFSDKLFLGRIRREIASPGRSRLTSRTEPANFQDVVVGTSHIILGIEVLAEDTEGRRALKELVDRLREGDILQFPSARVLYEEKDREEYLALPTLPQGNDISDTEDDDGVTATITFTTPLTPTQLTAYQPWANNFFPLDILSRTTYVAEISNTGYKIRPNIPIDIDSENPATPASPSRSIMYLGLNPEARPTIVEGPGFNRVFLQLFETNEGPTGGTPIPMVPEDAIEVFDMGNFLEAFDEGNYVVF